MVQNGFKQKHNLNMTGLTSVLEFSLLLFEMACTGKCPEGAKSSVKHFQVYESFCMFNQDFYPSRLL